MLFIILIAIFFPKIMTAIVKAMPASPTNMPIKIVIPSLLNMPKAKVKMAIAGTKLVKGKGRAIETVKIKEKKPIILVPLWEEKNSKRGFRKRSILLREGEDFVTIKLRVLLFMDNLVIHFGSQGESKARIIWPERKKRGTANIVVTPGM